MKQLIAILALGLLVLGFGGAAQAQDFPGTKILFETGKAELPVTAADDLKKVADYLAANAAEKVMLEGFVDSTGPADVNKELAKQRAFAVRDALKVAGVAEDRIVLQKPEDITAGDGEQARKVEVLRFAQAAAAPAEAASAPEAAPAAAPVPDKGDVSWMLLSTLLVIMMAIPGLALFYGGLVRSKNMLSVLMQVFVTFSMIVVLWVVYGYSLAFTEGNAFIGGFDRLFLNGVFDPAAGTFAMAATFSKGVVIPEIIFVAFQATFAAITCGLIVGAFAERIKFSAVLMFMAIWFTFSYAPIAHMVWYWMGPDAYTAASVVDEMNAKAGLIWQWGALDFAGGTVVHINAAVAGLVGAYVIGKRVGYGKESMAPHNLTLTMVGASLLWVGWFGFNAGSALEAGNSAALAFMNTFSATAAAVLAWCAGEALMKGKASMLGAASGAVAGLVAITPAAGNVGIVGALVIGGVAGIACLWGVNGLKKMLGADDSLDVFGVHGVGGIVGALLTGVFNTQALGGPGLVTDWVTATVGSNAIGAQVWIQLKAVLLTIVWSGVVSFIAYKVVDLTIGLRVPEDEEREGLDITSHGETAYGK
ncbi:MAG: ammonium transporter [Rubrivivax sp.]|jgi:Amt family ammonium transporter|nr:ammonium transporter [Rubrivivax sp.]MBP9909970.1 ammonium transporter [Rubrivivax sp.]